MTERRSATAGRLRGVVALRGLGLGLVVACGAAPPPVAGEPAVSEFFEAKVRPVLVTRCQSCHGPKTQKAGLRLDSREGVLRGGETGPAAVPGKPAESLLVEAVNYGDAVQMPPKSRLPADEVAALTRWVEAGLPWPGQSSGAEAVPTGATAGKAEFDLQARRRAHWAWRAVDPQAPPSVKDADWPAGPEDRFLLARLEAKGLRPAPDADRRALIRRLTFDLTGLPPTPAEVDAFSADDAPGAYERLADRLLASPRFGERWGRHWLDLVRYAETRGHEFDPPIPNAWQYRDYVVRALNADVPYDGFLAEHVAGDLLPRPRLDPATGGNESVLGTGFWFLGEEVHSPVDVRQDEADRLDNRLDVMTKTFLGLTVACARCHDHKFDAISQRDYYALSGYLISSSYRQVRFAALGRERSAAETLRTARDAARARVLAAAARAAGPEVEHLAETLLGVNVPHSGNDARGARWAEELRRARDDRRHPLHGFAALTGDGADHRPFADRVRSGSGGGPAPSAADARVVVDFGALGSLERWQDGFAFGLRPDRPGDLRRAPDGAPEPFEVVEVAAARRDPSFRGMGLADGTQKDHGRLGTWDRAGQTLRTPEFTIGSGRLWYRVRGAGRAYASVNSHLVVDGPLHGAVLTEWPEGDRGWRWVRHDLSAYKGHRAHVEICPSGPGDLEVAAVVDSPNEPTAPDPADRTLRRALSAPGVGSPEALARAYQEVLGGALRRMAADDLAGSDDPGDDARIAGWVLRNLDLFGPAGSAVRGEIAAEAARLRGVEDSAARRVGAGSPAAPAVLDGNGVDEFLMIRGSSKTPGPQVPRRFLEALGGVAAAGPGSGRDELARRMTDPSNPFASRVIVNRVWHHLFGRGVVASVDNFGVLGEPPTHPELLDYLAGRFMEGGWSVKGLVRSLVLTRAYRMSSRPDPAADALDPDNRLWHRMPVRRLEAEPLRDAILAVSGRLDGRMFGPGVPIYLTPYMQGRGRPKVSGPVDGGGRRSLYLGVRRNFLAPMMLAFDAPIPFSTVGRRNVSNVPAQALILMNDPFVVGQARAWADRVLAPGGTDPGARVDAMYRAAFGRPPAPAERADALAFLESQGRELGLAEGDWRSEPRAWADLAHVLLNSKEFLFLD